MSHIPWASSPGPLSHPVAKSDRHSHDITIGEPPVIAIEAMAIEIVSFPINTMVIFHSYVTVYQRVTGSINIYHKLKNSPIVIAPTLRFR